MMSSFFFACLSACCLNRFVEYSQLLIPGIPSKTHLLVLPSQELPSRPCYLLLAVPLMPCLGRGTCRRNPPVTNNNGARARSWANAVTQRGRGKSRGTLPDFCPSNANGTPGKGHKCTGRGKGQGLSPGSLTSCPTDKTTEPSARKTG